METRWSDWTWDPTRQCHYKYRHNARGEVEYDWEEVMQADPSTPRASYSSSETNNPQTASDSSFGYSYPYGSNYAAGNTDSSLTEQYTQNTNYGYTAADNSSGSPGYSFQQGTSAGYGEVSAYQAASQQQNSGSNQQTSNQATTEDEPKAPPERTITAEDAARPTEALDPKFRRLRDVQEIRRFFRSGRVRCPAASMHSVNGVGSLMIVFLVFSLLWTEPSSQNLLDNEMNDAFTEVRWGQTAYTEIRRFIVIKAFTHHSLCVPIATYQRHGTTRRPDAQHHSVAYSSNKSAQLLAGENLTRHSIPIITESGETLESESRINFSKIYTIEHNVKVNLVGKVHQDYLEWVLQYCKESTGIETRR